MLYITSSFFFFNDTATTEIYTLSLHDALPILIHRSGQIGMRERDSAKRTIAKGVAGSRFTVQPEERSEEHTSELQSQSNLVCRLLLEKKNINFLDESQERINYFIEI